MMNRASYKNDPREWAFLLALLRTVLNAPGGSPTGASADKMALPNELDWFRLLELAEYHRVLPLLFPLMQKFDGAYIPANVRDFIEREKLTHTLKMLKLSAETENVSRALEGEGIRSLILKGPVLAIDLYGDLSLRSSKDLDILVPFSELQRADELFRSLGYVKEEPLPSVLGDWRWRCHHDIYLHHGKQVCIEVHWRLHPGPSNEPNFDVLWGRRRRSVLSSYPINYLGEEDLFLYLAYHGARHGWFRLRWLSDIGRLASRGMDWGRLKEVCGLYGMTLAAGQAFALSARLLHSAIPEPFQKIAERRLVGRLEKQAMHYLTHSINLEQDERSGREDWAYRRYLYALRSRKQQLVYLVSLLYPSPLDAQALPLPNKLHALYFVLRPPLLFWRKAKKMWLAGRDGV